MIKKIILIITSLILLSGLYFLTNNTSNNSSKVYFFDVGQGDSALIRTTKKQNILIDGGPGDKVIHELSKVLPWHERTIDLMILTHPHNDHVRGLNEVLARYKVEQVLYSGVIHSGPAFLLWLENLRDHKIKVKIIDRPQTIILSPDSQIEILYPWENISGQTVENLNNTSLVVRYLHGKSSFLFMGDIEKEAEEELLDKKIDVQAKVVKLGHHGSDTSSTEKFLQAVNPEYAIVSAGVDNDFGHPSLRVLQRLKRMEIKVLETSKQGTIGFTCHQGMLNFIK